MQAVRAPEDDLLDAGDRDVDRRGVCRSVTRGRPDDVARLLVERHERGIFAAGLDEELVPRHERGRGVTVRGKVRRILPHQVVLPDGSAGVLVGGQ